MAVKKIRIRRGLQADLPTLDIGEFGFTTDTNKLYIGSAGGNLLVNPAEQDNIFEASVASDILQGDIDNWNEAFEWGDHSEAGYLTSLPEHNHDSLYSGKPVLLHSRDYENFQQSFNDGFEVDDNIYNFYLVFFQRHQYSGSSGEVLPSFNSEQALIPSNLRNSYFVIPHSTTGESPERFITVKKDPSQNVIFIGNGSPDLLDITIYVYGIK
jgi:hypothetical protein